MIEMDLFEAVRSDDLAAVRRLEKLQGKSLNVNIRCPEDGSTPLYISASNGYLMMTDWLIRHGAKPHYKTKKSGSIPLHGAAARGQCNCVRLLIRSCPSSVNYGTKINGDTALHLAAYRGHVDVCRILMARGASPYILNYQSITALDESRITNNYDVFQLLLNYQLNITHCSALSEMMCSFKYSPETETCSACSNSVQLNHHSTSQNIRYHPGGQPTSTGYIHTTEHLRKIAGDDDNNDDDHRHHYYHHNNDDDDSYNNDSLEENTDNRNYGRVAVESRR